METPEIGFLAKVPNIYRIHLINRYLYIDILRSRFITISRQVNNPVDQIDIIINKRICILPVCLFVDRVHLNWSCLYVCLAIVNDQHLVK